MDKLFYLHRLYKKHDIRLLLPSVRLGADDTCIFHCACGLFFIHHEGQPCWESASRIRFSEPITAAILALDQPEILRQWREYCRVVTPHALAGKGCYAFWKNYEQEPDKNTPAV